MLSVDDAQRRRLRRRGWWLFGLGLALGMMGGGWIVSQLTPPRPPRDDQAPRPRSSELSDATVAPSATESSMAEVLQIAKEALAHLRANVNDYTATIVKQESIEGVVGEPNEMFAKIHCRHRGAKLDDSEPMRVYLRFEKPADVAGREVIWCEDLHDGKLIAHEAGLLGLMTVRLDPTGLIAMRGQKYPIYDIGLTNLLKKLIERGQHDVDNPDVVVTIARDIPWDEGVCDLIEVQRAVATGRPDDFYKAEICFDRSRKMPIRYTAFGWPQGTKDRASAMKAESAELLPPVLESYTYRNIQINVGLTDMDFDPANPDYQFR